MRTAAFLPALAALAAAHPAKLHKIGARDGATAILQFEIDQDTFTSNTQISVPGSLAVNQKLIGAMIADGDSDVSCEALDSSNKPIGEPFTTTHFTTFSSGALVLVSSVKCSVSSSSSTGTSTGSADAILDLEIAPDTFTSDLKVQVPGTVTVNEALISASVADADGVADKSSVSCVAFDAKNKQIGGAFSLATRVVFNNGALVQVSTIRCSTATSTTSAPPSSTTTAASSATAVLQFEIGQDEFTSSTEVAVPGEISVSQKLIGALVASVSGVTNAQTTSCQAFNGQNKVGEPFTTSHFTTFNKGKLVEITSVKCQ